jgi:hypothetical protein
MEKELLMKKRGGEKSWKRWIPPQLDIKYELTKC